MYRKTSRIFAFLIFILIVTSLITSCTSANGKKFAQLLTAAPAIHEMTSDSDDSLRTENRIIADIHNIANVLQATEIHLISID